MENLNRSYNQIITLFDEKEPRWSNEKKHIVQYGNEYYITLKDFRMSEIGCGARVKTAAKYFKKYEMVKIFQLKNTIYPYCEEVVSDKIIKDVVSEEIQEMREKLTELVDGFSEI